MRKALLISCALAFAAFVQAPQTASACSGCGLKSLFKKPSCGAPAPAPCWTAPAPAPCWTPPPAPEPCYIPAPAPAPCWTPPPAPVCDPCFVPAPAPVCEAPKAECCLKMPKLPKMSLGGCFSGKKLFGGICGSKPACPPTYFAPTCDTWAAPAPAPIYAPAAGCSSCGVSAPIASPQYFPSAQH